ncbi:uncharacterized protein LOC5520842 isoform X2 [Nematostella vectensis]|uniref:uncharacterized protein LOC5520842 isoform X2 n=1 Tax=Nematostella vectensis TaxID=45351 RepID=UPI0020773052|nr:uncharacterized protein LOC5520842 isoform X2 [Nematostella vectensis]
MVTCQTYNMKGSLPILIATLFACVRTKPRKEAACRDPLGLASGKIKDDQITVFSAFDDNFNTFGAHRARLNLTSWPPGHRANLRQSAESWIKLELKRKFVITGIATQGYGDPDVGEWVKQYMVLYSTGKDYLYFEDQLGNLKTFAGNRDANTAKFNLVPVPTIASSIMLMPLEFEKNFALRLELYGCEPGYHFVVSVMVRGARFTTDYVDPSSSIYKSMKQDTSLEIAYALKGVPGYLSGNFLEFRPEKSTQGNMNLVARMKVDCIEASVHYITTALKNAISDAQGMFDSSYLTVQYPLDVQCRPPNVSITLSKSSANPTVFYITEENYLKANVILDCNVTQDTVFVWEQSRVDHSTKQLLPPLSFGLGSKSLNIAPRSWSLGLIYVRFTAKMESQEGAESSDFGFVSYRMPLIVGKIDGPKDIIKGAGPIILDGTSSFDPYRPFLKNNALTFTWLCRRQSETFENISMVQTVDTITEGRPRDKGGCYGYGPGVLNTTEPMLDIKEEMLPAKVMYVFRLIVRSNYPGEAREMWVEHSVRVNSSITVSLRCTSNCAVKVSPQNRMVIESACKGLTCRSVQKYMWELYTIDPFGESGKFELVQDLERRILTELDSPSIAFIGKVNMFENSLAPDQRYRVKVIASLPDGTSETAMIEFNTNSAPYPAMDEDGCFIRPEVGRAVTTEYNISCRGFKDEDLPLSYEFRYHTVTGMVVVDKTYSTSITTMLPVGEADVDYQIIIEVLIIDALGASYTEFLPVTVQPMPASDVSSTLMSLTSGENSQMSSLMKSGNVAKAAQMAYAVLSLVDKSEGGINAKDKQSAKQRAKMRKKYNFNKEKAKKLKEGIINQISKVNVKSLQEVTQVSAVVALATGQKDEISQDSQETAVNLLESSANFMSSQKGGDPALVQKVGASLLHGVSNLMSAASSEATVKEEETEEEKKKAKYSSDGEKAKDGKERKKRGKKMAEKTLKLMDQIGGSLLSTKVVGEKPSVFKTKSLALVLDRQIPSKMGEKKISEGSSKVALPSAGTLFSKASKDMPAVDSQMMAFKDNPFTWDPSAKNVKSSVVEFTLKTPDGKELEINGLSEPIELYIPQKQEQQKPKTDNDTEPEEYFAKPSKGSKNIRSHQITIPSEDMAVTVVIKPQDGKSLEVYVNRLVKPTPQKYKLKKILPDFSSCLEYNETSGYTNCTSDPYTLMLSAVATGGTGLHFIGVRYFQPDAPPTISTFETRVRRDCFSHNGRMKRGCVGVKDPPTTPAPTPLIIIPKYNASTDVNYTMSVSMTGCLYWSNSKSKWTGEGCKVGPNSDASKLHCLCNHLSAFGGDFFVAPNPIDFDKVFAEFGRMGETGNFVVLSTICVIWGLFIAGMIFARKADKKDEKKVIANVDLAENIENGFVYQISVQTGMWRGYGTTANVGLSIFGEEGKTGDILLTDPELEKVFFARGSINNFTLVVPEDLGELTKIKIWHDNSGKSPAWFFHQVMIVDMQTEKQYYFLANRWLAVEKGDGQIDIEIPKAEKKDLSGFRNLFYSRTAKSLGDGHLWLSLFTRPPHNPFTRCQRLGCCLSILFATMVTNAMFYQFGASPKDTFQIGPLKMSWTQIKIGIQSSIIAIPVNIIIVTIFRSIKVKTNNDQNSNNNDQEKPKTPGCLPPWFTYIGWTLCILTALAASAFTFFYSLMWGADVSNNWLTSIMVSFFQDVIITQPIKVVAIASLLSLVIKKPPQQEKVFGKSLSKKSTEGNVMAPKGQELEKQRIYRTKVIAMFRTIVEIVFFLIFLLLVVVVCYGNRKSTRYLMTQGMEQLFSKFETVTSPEKFWEWTDSTLLPALYEPQWYNGKPFEYDEGFISSREAFVVGMPRLRQVRLKPDPLCQVESHEPMLAHMFHRCLPLYKHSKEDKTPWNMPMWKPVRNLTRSMSILKLQDICPKPWRYQSASALHSLSFTGLDLVYDGGGYVADLGYNMWQAKEVISNLQKNNWIDDKTGGVFVEFTVFEPTTSLFSAVKYLYERFRTGGTNTRATVRTLVLYASADTNMQSFFQVCQLMLMLMILFFLFVEFGKIYRQGREYPKQFWNWMELIQILCTVAAIVMFFFKEKYTSEFVQRVRDNPFETSSTDYIVLWSDCEIYLLSLVIFIITIKFLRLIRFNRSICQMTGTITKSAKSIANFFIVFVAVLLAFTQLGFLAFGSRSTPYSSFFQSLRSCLQMVLGGDMHFFELQDINRILGPAFAFVYMLSMTMILLNMFLAILNDSYEETKEFEGESFGDADLAEFMSEYFRTHIGYLKTEAGNLMKKFKSLLLSKLKTPKEKDEYKEVPVEESFIKTEIPVKSELDGRQDVLSIDKIRIASFESFNDIISDGDDEMMSDIRKSVSDVRNSMISLRSSIEDEDFMIKPSIKWDTPTFVQQPAQNKPGSIFDPPVRTNGSIFDMPLYNPRGSPYLSKKFMEYNKRIIPGSTLYNVLPSDSTNSDSTNYKVSTENKDYTSEREPLLMSSSSFLKESDPLSENPHESLV